MSFSRRALLKASAASAVIGGVGAPFVARAQQAEFTYKFANNLPDAHPLNIRAKEMSAAIKTETSGRVDVRIFPNNQLGADTDVLSQLRSGGAWPGSKQEHQGRYAWIHSALPHAQLCCDTFPARYASRGSAKRPGSRYSPGAITGSTPHLC